MFNESGNEKKSSRRVIGTIGAIICLVIFIGLFFFEAEQISDTLLISMFGSCILLLGSTVIPKKK